MTEFRYLEYYEDTFTPRDNDEYVLKAGAKKFIGTRLRLQYFSVIDDDRPKFEGDHEFILPGDAPLQDGMPLWFSEKDLSDIVAV